METVTKSLGSKITADGDWSHEIKRCLLLGRKAMANLDSILKSKDITLLTKDCKEIKPVNPKGNQPWIFIGRTDAEVEAPTLWPPDTKNWLTRKDPDDGKDWRREEKGTTEDEVVGWHHWLDGHKSEQAPGVGDGQGSLACYSPWDRKELDMTKRLNWTDLVSILQFSLLDNYSLKPRKWLSLSAIAQGSSLKRCISAWLSHNSLACCDSWGRKELDMTEQLIWSDSFIASFES